MKKEKQSKVTFKEIQMALEIWIDINVHNCENKIKRKIKCHFAYQIHHRPNTVWMRVCVNRHPPSFGGALNSFKGQIDVLWRTIWWGLSKSGTEILTNNSVLQNYPKTYPYTRTDITPERGSLC